MQTITRQCGWDDCEVEVSKINPRTNRPFYYCAEHTEARKAHKQAYYKNNKEKHNKASLDRYYKLRKEVIEMYGGKCTCCGEEHEAFLALDHVNDGGQKHRKQRSIYGVYKDALAANDPKEFRVLCHNCNMAYHTCGICPHQLS